METKTIKNKKKLLSGKLYGEMIKQTRTVAVALLVICLIITACSLITSLISWNMEKNSVSASVADKEYFQYCESASSIAPVLTAFMYIGVLLIVMKAFSYQNRRADCDFYHAIPATRTNLFASTLLACLTWIAITIIATVLLVVVVCAISGMSMPYMDIPYCLGTYLSGSILVCAVVALAMSITGTTFANLVLTGLILFLPRFITLFAGMCMSSMSEIVPLGSFGFMYDVSYNIPVGIFVSPFLIMFGIGINGATDGMSGGVSFYNTLHMLYTLVLSIVYIVLACLAANKRKSETAGASANSKLLQHVYRCAIALPPILLLAALIMLDEWRISLALVLIAVSLIVYFLFELITTKDIKKVAKAAPVYLAVILFAVVFGLVVKLTANISLNFTYDVADIKSVGVVSTENDNGFDYYGYATYQQILAGELRYDDAELISNLSKQLDWTIENVKKDDNKRDEHYSNSGDYYVTFYNKNGGKITRRLSVDGIADYELIESKTTGSQRYTDAMNTLPKKNEITAICVNGARELSSSKAQELFEIYKEERKGLNAQKNELLNNDEMGKKFFVVDGFRNHQMFSSMYNISAQYTPKTFSKIVSMLHDLAVTQGYSAEMSEQLRLVKEIMSDAVSAEMMVNFNFYSEIGTNGLSDNGLYSSYSRLPDTEEYDYAIDKGGNPKVDAQILALIDYVEKNGVATELTENTVEVTMNAWLYNEETYESQKIDLCLFVTLDKESFSELYSTLEEYNESNGGDEQGYKIYYG